MAVVAAIVVVFVAVAASIAVALSLGGARRLNATALGTRSKTRRSLAIFGTRLQN